MNKRIEQAEFDQIVKWQEGDTEAISAQTLSNLKRVVRALGAWVGGWERTRPNMKFPIWSAIDQEDSYAGFPNLPLGVPRIEIDFRNQVVTAERLFTPVEEPLTLATLHGINIGRRGIDFEISDGHYNRGLFVSRRGLITVTREPLHPKHSS